MIIISRDEAGRGAGAGARGGGAASLLFCDFPKAVSGSCRDEHKGLILLVRTPLALLLSPLLLSCYYYHYEYH